MAIKVIPAQYLKQDEDGQQRLRRELTNLHKLKHENIIQIKGCENTKNNTYIALEFCNGGNLLQYQKYYQKKNDEYSKLVKVVNKVDIKFKELEDANSKLKAQIEKNEYIIEENTEGEQFYLIIKGRVRITAKKI